jgi:3-hydroxyisobutyrate dehydrogenase
MSQRIGFVGLGRMGANMARRLKEVGENVAVVYDTRPGAAEELAKEIGAKAASKLAAVTAGSDVIFTVVTDDAAMKAIYAKRGDSLLAGAKGRLFINCATISPAIHVEIEKRVTAVGASSLEACMASSIPQARQGNLFLMAGGDPATFDAARGLLTKLSDDGKLLRYIGATGRAAQVKALVNMVMNINTAGLAEGLGLAHSLGLDLGLVREIFSLTGAGSRVLVTDGEDMQNRAHDCFFSAAHAAKDSGIAHDLGVRAGLHLPLAKAALGQFQRMIELGLGELDKSGVAELTFKGRGKTKKKAKAKPAAKKAAKKPAPKTRRK